MKLISKAFEVIEQGDGFVGAQKNIERAGRICYKSESNITEDSCIKFTERMVANKHRAMLEHGTVYLKRTFNTSIPSKGVSWIEFYEKNKYSAVRKFVDIDCNGDCIVSYYVTTNYRVIVENEREADIENYWCDYVPSRHERRISVFFTIDIGIGREFLRHRTMSFANESTRYCNYAKDKFSNEITYVIPEWIEKYQKLTDKAKCEFYDSLKDAEKHYMNLISYGCTPQEARGALLLWTKSEIVITGFVSDWEYLFDLRYFGITGAAHPDAKEISKYVYEEFVNRGYISAKEENK